MHTYRNPWHKPQQPTYGPASFTCATDPIEYRGFQIFRRLPACFDVVKDGVCVHQRAGVNGAKSAINARLAKSAGDTKR